MLKVLFKNVATDKHCSNNQLMKSEELILKCEVCVSPEIKRRHI